MVRTCDGCSEPLAHRAVETAKPALSVYDSALSAPGMTTLTAFHSGRRPRRSAGPRGARPERREPVAQREARHAPPAAICSHHSKAASASTPGTFSVPARVPHFPPAARAATAGIWTRNPRRGRQICGRSVIKRTPSPCAGSRPHHWVASQRKEFRRGANPAPPATVAARRFHCLPP